MLVVLSVLSMAIGNVVAMAQTNLKRMLAYSTISHVGYILLGILSGTAQGYQAAMFYMISYVIVASGSFGMILLLARQGFEADKLVDFKGLNARSPWFAGMMAILMFSLAGVPPFVGFWAKLGVIQAVLDVGYTWLAVVAVLFSVVGAFFYLRIVKLMYFDDPTDSTVLGGSDIDAHRAQRQCAAGVRAGRGAVRFDCSVSTSVAIGLPAGQSVGTTCISRLSRYNGRLTGAGWSSLAARRAHNPKVAGSNPAPATN